jgi:hypothetical protein
MLTVKEVLPRAIERIQEGCDKVEVNLHLHFDRDDDFDYTGCHTLSVNVWKDKRYCMTHSIDLEGWAVIDCRKEHMRVFNEVRKHYPLANRREFEHK